MKPVIGSLMLLLVFLMVIHSFWKWSRQFPPAHEREPSGVEGGLIVLVGLMAAAVLFNATGFGLMVLAVMGAVPEGFWIRTGLPEILSFAGIVWAMLRLLWAARPPFVLKPRSGAWPQAPSPRPGCCRRARATSPASPSPSSLRRAPSCVFYLSPRSKHTYG